ncbi:MAG: ABC transporter ATP-binding protein [Anaerolineales bacterium]|nr:ABC transporter ATP-binding protein [Anaerolineales bacterium]
MLEVSNLTVSFERPEQPDAGAFRVVEDLSFGVAAGEFVSILGPSGCGKTTLLRVIVRLAPAEHGTIKIDDSEKYAPGRDVCLVFQSYGLFPWRTVRENVEFGLKMQGVAARERRATGQEFIDLVGLSGFEQHYPHQISGGMQQRVGLARALACRPKLLLMDEPFAAVDAQTRERLQTELLRIVAQTASTVVFVTHSIQEAVYLGTRVLVMGARPGRIAADLPVPLGSERWRRDVRLERRFEDHVLEARQALRAVSP